MAELLSPKQRLPAASRLQSPTSPVFLLSNDDQLERAQARAARAAAIRRKSLAPNALPRGESDGDACLGKRQILELFQNCIKLASENKINQRNTWELNLIDHLAELIKVEENDDSETNFQKASCTLEAGVKIYSLRVDSVHSEAYKVLGGMNRAGQEDEQDVLEPGDADSAKEGVQAKKETDKKISPLSTLESSFEALNVKKFDVAFSVDPLYHQTSAQFDEGGAKGLLMNNLGVYGGCKVLFDSQEVPGKCLSNDEQNEKSTMIDLLFAKEYVEEMLSNMQIKDEISPSLRNIVDRFNEDNRRPSEFYSSGEKPVEDVINNDAEFAFDDGGNEDCMTWNDDHDDGTAMVDERRDYADSSFPENHEETESCTFNDNAYDDRFDRVDEYLFSNLGLALKQNSWAGPEHWKYRKVKGSDVDPPEKNVLETASKKKNKKQAELEINFTKSLEKDFPDIFAPPKNPKVLLLPANKAVCITKLPEDCHYQPEDLVKLFLLPNLKCIGRRTRKFTDNSAQHGDEHESYPSWDDASVLGGQFDDVVESDEEPTTLVSQPRQVNKIEVQYDKTSKQVDVHSLKETLWDQLQESRRVPLQDEEEPVSFKKMLANFPEDSKAAPMINDVSPHLCFICLLHLANEHGLRIEGKPEMDDLIVHIPRIAT